MDKLTTDPRELAIIAFSDSFTLADAMVAATEPTLAAAIEQYQASMVPVAEVKGEERKTLAQRLADQLRPIGAKLDPAMSHDNALAWRMAVADSMSKWPFRVALAAIKDGITEPYEFGIKSVDKVLHKLAEPHFARHERALGRLRMMQRELERAKAPKLAAPDGYEGGKTKPLTKAELRKLASSELGPTVIRLGLKHGHLTAEELAAAGVELPAEKMELASKQE